MTLGTAAIYGLRTGMHIHLLSLLGLSSADGSAIDLHLSGEEYSWAGSILSVGVGGIPFTTWDWIVQLTTVLGYRWNVALLVSRPSITICKVSLCMLNRMVSDEPVAPSLSQCRWLVGPEVLDG